MVVNAPTASRAAFLRRTVVSQLTVDKLKKGLPKGKGERVRRRKATAPESYPTARNDEQHQAHRNLQPRRCWIVHRVSLLSRENDDDVRTIRAMVARAVGLAKRSVGDELHR
jgi:hypothetical protein